MTMKTRSAAARSAAEVCALAVAGLGVGLSRGIKSIERVVADSGGVGITP